MLFGWEKSDEIARETPRPFKLLPYESALEILLLYHKIYIYWHHTDIILLYKF